MRPSWCCRYSPEPVAPGALALVNHLSRAGLQAKPPEPESSGSDPLSPVLSDHFQHLPHLIGANHSYDFLRTQLLEHHRHLLP